MDGYARSVVACGLDGQMGELFERRLTPGRGEVAAGIEGLPGPAVVTYEAGPTGFGGVSGHVWVQMTSMTA